MPLKEKSENRTQTIKRIEDEKIMLQRSKDDLIAELTADKNDLKDKIENTLKQLDEMREQLRECEKRLYFLFLGKIFQI